ncbi:ComEA family DNA-binding protein [Thermodesulfobacteriota bacterium]
MPKHRKWMALIVAVAMTLISLNAAALAADSGKININTASVEELAQLDRVGTQYAQRIVAYREANGPFTNPQDILNVKGIGQKTLEANKNRIVVK